MKDAEVLNGDLFLPRVYCRSRCRGLGSGIALLAWLPEVNSES